MKAAAALATASETPRIAFAPSFFLFAVPSSSIIRRDQPLALAPLALDGGGDGHADAHDDGHVQQLARPHEGARVPDEDVRKREDQGPAARQDRALEPVPETGEDDRDQVQDHRHMVQARRDRRAVGEQVESLHREMQARDREHRRLDRPEGGLVQSPAEGPRPRRRRAEAAEAADRRDARGAVHERSSSRNQPRRSPWITASVREATRSFLKMRPR